jgi:hypothetical protein
LADLPLPSPASSRGWNNRAAPTAPKCNDTWKIMPVVPEPVGDRPVRHVSGPIQVTFGEVLVVGVIDADAARARDELARRYASNLSIVFHPGDISLAGQRRLQPDALPTLDPLTNNPPPASMRPPFGRDDAVGAVLHRLRLLGLNLPRLPDVAAIRPVLACGGLARRSCQGRGQRLGVLLVHAGEGERATPSP